MGRGIFKGTRVIVVVAVVVTSLIRIGVIVFWRSVSTGVVVIVAIVIARLIAIRLIWSSFPLVGWLVLVVVVLS